LRERDGGSVKERGKEIGWRGEGMVRESGRGRKGDGM